MSLDETRRRMESWRRVSKPRLTDKQRGIRQENCIQKGSNGKTKSEIHLGHDWLNIRPLLGGSGRQWGFSPNFSKALSEMSNPAHSRDTSMFEKNHVKLCIAQAGKRERNFLDILRTQCVQLLTKRDLYIPDKAFLFYPRITIGMGWDVRCNN